MLVFRKNSRDYNLTYASIVVKRNERLIIVLGLSDWRIFIVRLAHYFPFGRYSDC